MRLDRNINGDSGDKYALVNMRKVREMRMLAGATKGGVIGEERDELNRALKTLERFGVLDYGEQGTESEFFVIKLRDMYAQVGLNAYGEAAQIGGDPEYAEDIWEMARRAGPDSPFCKDPD